MFEHVGVRNHRTCFETARQLLSPDGVVGGAIEVR
jgi:cyclopropane fatty-acyl-phospholipid synthase-like methyltransferase